MAKLTKEESRKVGKLAKELRVYLESLDKKTNFEDCPDLYAADYDQLSRLDDEFSWWLF